MTIDRVHVPVTAMWSKATLGLRATFEGSDALAIIAAAQALGWAPDLEGGLCDVDGTELDEPEPPSSMLARASRSFGVHYADYPKVIAVPSLKDPTVVRVGNSGVTVDMATLLKQLATIPFEVASFANKYLTKTGEKLPGVSRVSPGYMHEKLGWALAFRGRGHERLVSRRWLSSGPWKLWTEGEISVVQFHALDVDLPTAMEQAAPSYAMFDTDSATSGIIDPDRPYEPETSGARVEVNTAPSDEELHARAATGGPIAFVFSSDKEARAALPRIWPYGHEVWVKDKRLVGYVPPDRTPAWAKA